MLSVHYLEVLLDDLTALGFHQLGLPVLALMQFLADVIIQHSQLSKLVHLRYTARLDSFMRRFVYVVNHFGIGPRENIVCQDLSKWLGICEGFGVCININMPGGSQC